jgi:hypothetical protein
MLREERILSEMKPHDACKYDCEGKSNRNKDECQTEIEGPFKCSFLSVCHHEFFVFSPRYSYFLQINMDSFSMKIKNCDSSHGRVGFVMFADSADSVLTMQVRKYDDDTSGV